MLKDEQMMTMITLLAIILGAGTLIERSGVLSSGTSGENDGPVLVADAAIVLADRPTVIDVLTNDSGIADGDSDGLIVVQRPGCGTAFARDGKVRYVPAERCPRSQTFSYGVLGYGHGRGSSESGGQTGEVVVTLRFDSPPRLETAAAALPEAGLAAPAGLGALAGSPAAAPSPLAGGTGPGEARNPIALFAPPMPATPSFADLAAPAFVAEAIGGAHLPELADVETYPAPAIAALELNLAGGSGFDAGPVDPLPGIARHQAAPDISTQPSPAPRS